MSKFTSILVPIDFSETSELALAHAKRLAELYGACLHLLHVMEDTFLYAASTSPEYREPFEEAARSKLRELLTPEEHERFHTEVALTSGRAFAAIIEYAQNAGCDLIVVASHGRGAAAHMLLGSVAENILRTAHCPVYVVRQKAHEHVDI